MNRVVEIEARAKAATAGPWKAELRAVCHTLLDAYGDGNYTARDTFLVRGKWASQIYSAATRHDRAGSAKDAPLDPDAVFLAHAREDIPYLLGKLKAVEAWAKEHRISNHCDGLIRILEGE